MAQRIERLNQAALQGNIDDFYILIREDVKLLEHIDELPFVDTPLHIAATVGHIPFALEMLRLKPSFARKPNPNGLSPIHLALQNGQYKMVYWLVHVDNDLVRVKGREFITPLHYVAENCGDHLNLLYKFLSCCPKSIVDETIRKETAMHIALKHDNLEAFKFLVGWLKRSWFKNAASYEREVLNAWDQEGNTHWDILEGQTQVDNTEMRVMLRRAGASTGSSLSTVTTYEDYLRLPKFRSLERRAREVANFSDGKRNALLVIAALFVTVTYQAVLSPPGGLWQDDYKPETNQTLCNTTAPLKAGSSHLGINQTHCNTTAPHKAGTAIGLGGTPFLLFLGFNLGVFVISITVLAVLIPFKGINAVFWNMPGLQCLLSILLSALDGQ
uniref:PGG domain-containing protein n=1 Tax=Fagus sylvatica TaxID=28930 RepID=A0A2N9FM39_FAGSY